MIQENAQDMTGEDIAQAARILKARMQADNPADVMLYEALLDTAISKLRVAERKMDILSAGLRASSTLIESYQRTMKAAREVIDTLEARVSFLMLPKRKRRKAYNSLGVVQDEVSGAA